MKKFDKLKSTLLDKAKKKGACSDQYKRAYKATNEKELLAVIKDNIPWCVDNGVIDHEYFKGFNQKLYIESGVANTGVENTGFANAGNDNAGNDNAGNYNAGNYNAGNYNAGYYNAGNDNAGNYNAGYYNAGNYNAGNDNAGNYNAGNYNAGNDNAGNDNAGNYNAGSRNAGYSNAGNDNAGAFNNDEKPKMKFFNKESDWTFEYFRNSDAFRLLHQINTAMWISSGMMSEEEKKQHPYHVTTLGYTKQIPFKEAFTNAWHNWDAKSRKAFEALPNFDKTIFEEITGVK